MKYVCADCGHEQDSMARPCDNCRSIRVILIEVAERAGGPNWRSIFTTDHPVTKEPEHAED